MLTKPNENQEGKISKNFCKRDDQKWDVFKTARRMVKTNQGIIDEQGIRNDDGILAVRDEDKKMPLKSYLEKPLNTEFQWNRNDFPQADTVSFVPPLIDKE